MKNNYKPKMPWKEITLVSLANIVLSGSLFGIVSNMKGNRIYENPHLEESFSIGGRKYTAKKTENSILPFEIFERSTNIYLPSKLEQKGKLVQTVSYNAESLLKTPKKERFSTIKIFGKEYYFPFKENFNSETLPFFIIPKEKSNITTNSQGQVFLTSTNGIYEFYNLKEKIF